MDTVNVVVLLLNYYTFAHTVNVLGSTWLVGDSDVLPWLGAAELLYKDSRGRPKSCD